jgi:predicted ATPase
LVTLTGAGGVGKTRLAVQVAAQLASDFGDGVWCVDLAPITDSGLVPVAVARTLGLPDQPGRSTMDTLTRFIGDRPMMVVLDNCEHLLDACAALIGDLLGACPAATLLSTSREPIGVAGEVSWRVPSLSLTDEAIELFTDRARLAQPDFSITDDNAAAVSEICRRLDGMPLAIELAAARIRALSLTEILDGLHDRFRLLTGGARTAVRRQQTLRASVDWSHALLTEPERVLFRRLAVFLGGFDLEAAQAVCGDGDVARYQVLDQLILLVDKSLVVAETAGDPTRYRLLETVRQYALEKLGESGEADTVRARHRDHYTSMATSMAGLLKRPGQAGRKRRIEQAEIEIDNLRAAFAWSRENSDTERALILASSLQPLWLARGRVREGLAWFDAAVTEDNPHLEVAPAVRARALTDKAVLAASIGATDRMDQAEQALAIARDLDDPALKLRALTACGGVAIFDAEVARPYLAEAIKLARTLGDRWRLSQILGWQAYGALLVGDPIAACAAAQEGHDLAEALGNRFGSFACRWCLGWARMMQGELAGAAAQLGDLVADATEARDSLWRVQGLFGQGYALAYRGDTGAARAAATAAIDAAAELGVLEGSSYAALAVAALAAGDVEGAAAASEAAWQKWSVQPTVAAIYVYPMVQTALARGDLTAARGRADDAVSSTTGSHLSAALITRARVAIAQASPNRPTATPTARSPAPPTCRRIWSSPISSSASPRWAAMPAVTGRRPGFSARRTPPGNAWARSGLRCMTPSTKRRWRRCVIPWAGRTLTVPRARAPRCLSRKRSATHSAVAVSANGPQRLGIADPHRARLGAARRRRAGEQGHRRTAFRLTTDRANPPHTRLHQTGHQFPDATRAGSSPSPLT